ncbi:MAG: polysaccharide biosynthesis/export family protein [Candidatus Firestonebacteria bacterium]|nr:polysaccharide biosynthesis/export family protein [Candidatus Firestonebacteria bacterium]
MKNKYIFIIIILLISIINIKAEEKVSLYNISPSDVLNIEVWGKPELTKETIVRNDGVVTFLPIGDIQAIGKTSQQLSGEISKRLEEFFEKSIVTVSIKKPHGNKITILGGVNKPGEYYTFEDITLLEAIGIAGGFNLIAEDNRNIKIIRKDNVLKIQVSSLKDIESIKDNILIKNSDIIIVPENLENFIEKVKNRANINILLDFNKNTTTTTTNNNNIIIDNIKN